MKPSRLKITNQSDDVVYLEFEQPVDERTGDPVSTSLAPHFSTTVFCSPAAPVKITSFPPPRRQ